MMRRCRDRRRVLLLLQWRRRLLLLMLLLLARLCALLPGRHHLRQRQTL